MKQTLIALGSNLGDRLATLRAAYARLQALPRTANWRGSAIYVTQPQQMADAGAPPFLNAAAACDAELSPAEWLDALQQIERDFGRRSKGDAQSRTLDLDLLAVGETTTSGRVPELPHPRMHQRRFVLRPLVDVAPGWTHPQQQQTVAHLLRTLPPGEPAPVAVAWLGAPPAVPAHNPNAAMRVASEPAEIAAAVEQLRRAGRVGFVPTMGALHDGHRSLMRAALAECDSLIVSIFVNPLQFGPGEDFAAYPRPFEADLAICRDEGASLVLVLEKDRMYPPGFATYVSVDALGDHFCGRSRPGHFRGVTTVVAKLFNLARPHAAFFGQKDAQQALILRRLAADLDFGLDFRICPTVREADGLALSSRNAYLTPEQRRDAMAISRGLAAAAAAWQAGERRAGSLKDAARAPIAATPAFRLDYVDVARTSDLQPLGDDMTVPPGSVLAVAAFIGKARLIDNTPLPPDHPL